MTTQPLHDAAEPDRLTAALREAGVLGDARVVAVDVIAAHDTIVSRIVRLGLTCDGPASDAPRSLILKTAHPDFAAKLPGAGRQEVAFYRTIAPAMPGLTPRCFGSAWDAATTHWHLLLEDLSETHHIASAWPLPPGDAQCRSIMRALGRAHAAWWDHPSLGSSIGAWPDPTTMQGVMDQFAGHLARLSDHLGDLMTANRRALYRRLLEVWPRLMRRDYSRRNLTIVHGDAHVWNFLLPKDPARDDVRLFDFDQWRISVGAGDLAYMMALQWYPERRRRLEAALLDVYHDALLTGGVKGYDRAALTDDYRNEVLWHVTNPVWQWSVGIPPVIWWNNLERVCLAIDDLGCRELLD